MSRDNFGIPIVSLTTAEEISKMLDECGLANKIETKRKRGKIKRICIHITGKSRDMGGETFGNLLSNERKTDPPVIEGTSGKHFEGA